jgi:uncharacterized protein VirK/YbjX
MGVTSIFRQTVEATVELVVQFARKNLQKTFTPSSICANFTWLQQISASTLHQIQLTATSKIKPSRLNCTLETMTL